MNPLSNKFFQRSKIMLKQHSLLTTPVQGSRKIISRACRNNSQGDVHRINPKGNKLSNNPHNGSVSTTYNGCDFLVFLIKFLQPLEAKLSVFSHIHENNLDRPNIFVVVDGNLKIHLSYLSSLIRVLLDSQFCHRDLLPSLCSRIERKYGRALRKDQQYRALLLTCCLNRTHCSFALII